MFIYEEMEEAEKILLKTVCYLNDFGSYRFFYLKNDLPKLVLLRRKWQQTPAYLSKIFYLVFYFIVYKIVIVYYK